MATTAKKLGEVSGKCSHHPSATLVERDVVHPISKRPYKSMDCLDCVAELKKHEAGRCKPSTCMWCNFGNGKWRNHRK